MSISIVSLVWTKCIIGKIEPLRGITVFETEERNLQFFIP